MNQATTKRAESKAARRHQLIIATMECIAEHGLTSLTLAHVAQQAGVSIGLINLHFQSKENLLEQALGYLSAEYRQAWQEALVKAGDDPGTQLAALIDVDFSRPISEVKRMAVWFAFWGESKVRPTYRRLCAGQDREHKKILSSIMQALLGDGKHNERRAESYAITLSALTDGLWLDLLLHPREMTRKHARQICHDYLRGVLPDYSITTTTA